MEMEMTGTINFREMDFAFYALHAFLNGFFHLSLD